MVLKAVWPGIDLRGPINLGVCLNSSPFNYTLLHLNETKYFLDESSPSDEKTFCMYICLDF